MEQLRMLGFGDYFILFAIVILWPIYSHISLKRNPIEKLREDQNARLSSYNYTMLQLWGFAASIIAIWIWSKRPFSALGFQHELSGSLIISWIVVASLMILSGYQLYLAVNNLEARQKFKAQLKDVGEYTELLMPKTSKEYRRSMLVGITAGITEEIIFRGYIIWVLSLVMHPWIAGALSVCLFVFLHRYQERAGLVQVAGFAIVTTVIYLACGSLWPVIILHIGVDILNIRLAWQVGKSEQD